MYLVTTLAILFPIVSPLKLNPEAFDYLAYNERTELSEGLNEANLVNPKWDSGQSKSVAEKLIITQAFSTIWKAEAKVYEELEPKSTAKGKSTPSKTPLIQKGLDLLAAHRLKGKTVLWCGRGTEAKTPGELGSSIGTDSCCRDHDNCPMGVKGKLRKKGMVEYGCGHPGTKYDTEKYHYTVSTCICDQTFYSCLQRVQRDPSKHTVEDRKDANLIGRAYFNSLSPRCREQDENGSWVVRDYEFPFVSADEVEPEFSFLIEKQKGKCGENCDNINSTQFHGNFGEPILGSCLIKRPTGAQELEDKTEGRGESYGCGGEEIRRVRVDPEDVLEARVCAHQMKAHCDLPEGATGAWTYSPDGRRLQLLTFTKPSKENRGMKMPWDNCG